MKSPRTITLLLVTLLLALTVAWQTHALWLTLKEHDRLKQLVAFLPAPSPLTPVQRQAPGMRSVPIQQVEKSGSLFSNPEYARGVRADVLRVVDHDYADFLRGLRLPTDRKRIVRDLLVEMQLGQREAKAIAAAQGQPLSNTQEIVTGYMIYREIREKMEREIGEAGMRDYNEHARARNTRSVSDALELRLSYSDAPLSAEQKRRIGGILSSYISVSQINPDGVVAAALPSLSAEQVQAFSDVLQEEQAAYVRKMPTEAGKASK